MKDPLLEIQTHSFVQVKGCVPVDRWAHRNNSNNFRCFAISSSLEQSEQIRTFPVSLKYRLRTLTLYLAIRKSHRPATVGSWVAVARSFHAVCIVFDNFKKECFKKCLGEWEKIWQKQGSVNHFSRLRYSCVAPVSSGLSLATSSWPTE